MRLTVAICTWNRSRLLGQTLEQFRLLRVPPDVEWELLVIDNNSTDDTRQVVERFADELPLRYIFEPRTGKSYAANTAIENAKGDYIVWTDDDVLVDRDWIAEYAAAFRDWPDAGYFGGAIRPWFEGSPPDWLQRTISVIGGAYAVLPVPDDAGPIGMHPLPFGANWATKRSLHERFPFDPALGPRPGAKRLGEETELMRRLDAAGITGRWVPRARVRHFIPRNRQSLEYLRWYHFGVGAREFRTAEGPRMGLLGQPLWMWKQAIACELLYRMGKRHAPPSQWVEMLIRASQAWGGLIGIRERPGHAPKHAQVRA